MNESDLKRAKTLLVYLAVVCGLVVLAGINRKAGFQFLNMTFGAGCRVRDYVVVFGITPATIGVLWLMLRFYRGHESLIASLLFIMGVLMLGVGFGMHEPTNFMVKHYQKGISPEVRESLLFFDDQLGHWAFFVGFMLIALSGVFAEMRKPFDEALPKWMFSVVVVLGLIAAYVIYKNMVNERTLVDILVLLSTVIIAGADHFVKGSPSLRRLPILTALYLSCGIGALATLIGWSIR